MERNLSYESIRPHLETLRRFGCYQIDLKSPKRIRYAHRAYMALMLFLSVLYTTQEIIYVVTVRHELEKMIDTMFLMLTYSDFVYKQLVLWVREDKIEELLKIVKGPLFNQNEAVHRELLLKRARQSRLLLRAFNGAALTTCLLWVLYPAILYAKSKPFEFAIWLPFNHNISPQIYIALGYMWIQTSILAIGNTSTDAFVTFFFALCKTQLSILRFDLKNIVKKCEDESKATSKSFAEVFHQRFRKIILHYDEIVKVCNKTQDIFGGVTLYLFLINVWVICTSAYVMVKVSPMSVQFSSMCMYMICILTEICLYCYYGNEVTYESNSLIDSVFGMNWQQIPNKQRYNIIVFMERIKRPVVPMAGAFVPLSNTTFVSFLIHRICLGMLAYSFLASRCKQILRSSYSFYAFLKNSE